MSNAITVQKIRTFTPMFGAWLRRGWIWLALLVGGMLTLQHFITFGVNASQSLGQYTLFMVLKWDKNINRGDLVAFEYTGTNPYDKGLTWVSARVGCRVTSSLTLAGNSSSTARPWVRHGLPASAAFWLAKLLN